MTVVAKFSELESGTAHKVMVDGVPVALVRIEDEVFAIADTCSHADISLSLGMVWCETKQIECIKHGSAFSAGIRCFSQRGDVVRHSRMLRLEVLLRLVCLCWLQN